MLVLSEGTLNSTNRCCLFDEDLNLDPTRCNAEDIPIEKCTRYTCGSGVWSVPGVHQYCVSKVGMEAEEDYSADDFPET